MMAAFWLLLRVPGSAQVPQYLFPFPTSFPFRPIPEMVDLVSLEVVVVVVLVLGSGVHLRKSISHCSKAVTTSAY